MAVPDPANGAYQLAAVTRSDGVNIPLNTNVWVTDRTFFGLGRAPILENVLHLFDYNSSGTYTLTYTPLPSADTTPPASSVAPLPASSYAQIPLNWSGMDNPGGSGIAFYDIYVSQNDGPFTLWLARTTETGAIYQGAYGSTYAFYSLATDSSGNRESAPLVPEAQTTVNLTNSPPTILAATNVVANEGQTVAVTLPASDPDAGQILTYGLGTSTPPGVNLDSASGLLTWTTGQTAGASTNVFAIIVTDNGAPPLSATGYATVVIRVVNHAPVLAPIPDLAVNEGDVILFTNQAGDIDLPANTLTFSLVGPVPTGATLSSATGVFSWIPNSAQGASTNLFTVKVTDNGVPPLSATQQFTVIVRDAESAFLLDPGSTNLLAGEDGSVPCILTASLPLTNLVLQLNAPMAQLTNLTVQPLSPEVTSASLSVTGSNNYFLSLNLDPSRQTASVRPIISLDFLAVSNQHSAVVFITPSQLLGLESNGLLLTNGLAGHGRIIIVSREPVLDVAATNGLDLTLYGQPGTAYHLSANTNLAAGVWNPLTNFTLINRFLTLPVSPLGARKTFYRSQSP